MPLLAWSAYTGSMTAMQLQLGLVGLLLIATVAPSPCSIVGSWTAKQDADLDGRSKEAEWNVVFGSDGTMNYTHSVQVQAVEEYWYNGEYIDDCMQTQAFSALYEFSDDDLDFQNAHDCWDNVTCGNLVLPSPRCPAGSPGDVLFAYNCESMFWEEGSPSMFVADAYVCTDDSGGDDKSNLTIALVIEGAVLVLLIVGIVASLWLHSRRSNGSDNEAINDSL